MSKYTKLYTFKIGAVYCMSTLIKLFKYIKKNREIERGSRGVIMLNSKGLNYI